MLRDRLTSAANRKDDRPTITVQKEDDVQFVAELVAQVTTWLEVRSEGMFSKGGVSRSA